jgi:nucleoside-diphosphate-sugar epimerase
MTAIDTSRPVMVTGATGYIAGHIVRRLLEDGLTVHAAVRDPDNTGKLSGLMRLAEQNPGSIRFFKSDLLKFGSYANAMQGCELVFHTASPCHLTVEDPQRDLVDPALKGTRNVLEQVNDTPDVKRVVLTSSCGAILGDNIDLKKSVTGAFTEQDWNTTSSLTHQPYSYSKVVAEREAWRIAKAQDRWDLICINPSVVVGPGVSSQATSATYEALIKFADGSMKAGAPDYGIGQVDVKDVADAHIKAAFTPSAHGRYLVSAVNTSFPEVARTLRERFGDKWPFPRKTLPKWVVWLFGPLKDKTLTRRLVSRNVGHPFIADNSKSVRELGLTYRSVEDATAALFQQIVDAGLLRNR